MSQEESKTRRLGFSVSKETFDRLEALSKSVRLKYTTVFEALVWGATGESVQKGLCEIPKHLRVNKRTIMSDLMKLPAEELAHLLAISKATKSRHTVKD